MLFLSPFITAYCLIVAGILGAVLGSFLNCAAWRIVHGESTLKGRSHCPHCNHKLALWDLIPVVSYLALGGKCRYCRTKISPRYLLSELAGAVIYITVLLRYDFSWECLRMLYLLTWMLYASLVDLEGGWIPDRVCIFAAIGFFPLAYLSGGKTLILQGVIGAVGLFVPLLITVLFMDKVMGKETMGGGDLKLYALLGLYFGWRQVLFLTLLSCILGFAGLIVMGHMKKDEPLRFAPALAASAWITALCGAAVERWYLGLFR